MTWSPALPGLCSVFIVLHYATKWSKRNVLLPWLVMAHTQKAWWILTPSSWPHNCRNFFFFFSLAEQKTTRDHNHMPLPTDFRNVLGCKSSCKQAVGAGKLYSKLSSYVYFPWQFSLKNYVLVATMWKPKEWRTAPSCLLLLPGYSDTYLSNYTYNYAVDVVYYAGCHFRMEADSPPQKKGRGKLKKPNKESIQN